ncbi:two-component system response regulator OmpR [Pseudomarimonas arenosa]|uniref:Two-component system response regulator OmpR n=1 Tax=Pseudomarimonas arenosa TaxID=2774145 RepID=A0AAW3ZQM6_9GAMM|nr:two-component system response regulator OmpR [Pseudomarimonas arenosa]MBD8527840.1 two-component system response regulator OmpR [Pseudomarimonas arenosa]
MSDSDSAAATERILVVDDDLPLRGLLQRYLQDNGFEVLTAADCKQAEQQLDRHHIAAIVLDLMLPGEDGLSFCRRLRGQGVDTPIIMLTARGDDIDRIVGLEIGADDYLAKPGNPRELLARIRAVLRRRGPSIVGAPQAELGVVAFGRCQVDHAARTLIRDGSSKRLTSGEYALLAVFLRHPRQNLSRDRLLSLARGREHEPFERSIDVTVSRLRRLIEDDPKHPRHLQTVWGSGYVFVPD